MNKSTKEQDIEPVGEKKQEIFSKLVTDDMHIQKIVNGFYECIEKAQQNYKVTNEGFSELIDAMRIIKFLKDDLPF